MDPKKHVDIQTDNNQNEHVSEGGDEIEVQNQQQMKPSLTLLLVCNQLISGLEN